MKHRAGTALIAVDALRVGMYIHLDGGWMSHPFALNHFRLTSAEQIATIRGLGLKELRWSPALSELPEDAPAAALPRVTAGSAAAAPESASATTPPGSPESAASAPPEAAAPAPAGEGEVAPAEQVPAAVESAASATATLSVPVAAPAPAAAPVRAMGLAAVPAADSAATVEAEEAERRRAWRDERAALVACEQQFQQAATELRRLHDQVLKSPEQARDAAVALTGALADRMAAQGELCIRLLGESTGDRAVAHALNVTLLSMLMGRALGWSGKEMSDLGVGALLHDVGKLELPERLRQREEHFTASEARYYEEHVARGVAQARRMGLSAGALLVIGQHHEMADRSGFPLRIGSERMTAAARVVALVNRYDRLCNPGRAHLALTPHEAVSLLFAQYQPKFDTTVLGAFVKMMGVYPPGSVVQLTDDRLAIVVSVNSSRPLKPRVHVWQPQAGPGEEALLPLNLETVPALGIRRSLKPQALPREAVAALAPRTRVAYFFEPVTRPAELAGEALAA